MHGDTKTYWEAIILLTSGKFCYQNLGEWWDAPPLEYGPSKAGKDQLLPLLTFALRIKSELHPIRGDQAITEIHCELVPPEDSGPTVGVAPATNHIHLCDFFGSGFVYPDESLGSSTSDSDGDDADVDDFFDVVRVHFGGQVNTPAAAADVPNPQAAEPDASDSSESSDSSDAWSGLR